MSKKMILLFIVGYSSLLETLHASDLPYKPGELVVRFAASPTGEQLTIGEQNTVLASFGGGYVTHSYTLVPGLSVVKLPENRTVEDGFIVFRKVTRILYAEPNYRIRLLSTFPNDPKFEQQWGMYKIDAPEAWDIHTGSSSIIVAVLDTGIDREHPDLNENMWINTGEIAGNGIDDDDNGYVDDVYGWDFGQDDNDPSDYRWHGTHWAGIGGAVGNNNEGVAGTCWDVTIMKVKFCEPQMGREAFVDAAIDAIEYAVQMGANVLSCSWRIDDLPPFFFVPEALRDAVEAAGNEGVLLVAAAGNDGENIDEEGNEQYPASYDLDNIIAVMATESDDDKWSSSNYGPTSVDLGAPGTGILSTTPTYETEPMQSEGIAVDYDTASGTSMATPHVAGACALLWSVKPELSHLELKQILMDTVDEISALDGLCVTEGRLNV